jgi:putative DNA primase/helicase
MTTHSITSAAKSLAANQPEKAEQLNETTTMNYILARWIREDRHYIWVATIGSCFRYRHGCYVTISDEALKRDVEEALRTPYSHVPEGVLSGTVAKLRRQRMLEALPAPTNLLNLTNGLLNPLTGRLSEHSPGFVSTGQANVVFDPTAKAPRITKFLIEALPDRNHRNAVLEFLGYSLTTHTALQQSLYFVGPGGTGKGTLMRLMERLLGELYAGMTFKELEGKHTVAAAVGRRLIYVSEVPQKPSLMTWKRITGEDSVLIDPKYKNSYTTRLDAKFIISSNTLFRMTEDSANDSVVRRLVFIPFDQKPRFINPNLEAELCQELPGFLNMLIEAVQRLQGNSWTLSSPSCERLRSEFLGQSNPVIEFLEQTYVPDLTATRTKANLYADWLVWAKANGHHPMSIQSFSTKVWGAVAVLGWNVSGGRTNSVRHWKGLQRK